jgi:hypothetical protein
VIQARILVYKHAVTDLRTFMISRRTLLLTGTAGLSAAALSRFARAAPPLANDPVAIVNAIYARAAKGKGDGGGAFIIENRASKADICRKVWSRCGRRPTPIRRRATSDRSISIPSPIHRSPM